MLCVFLLSKQQSLLLSQQLGQCGVWKVSESVFCVLKQTSLHVIAQIFKNIHSIIWLFIHHFQQQASQVIVATMFETINIASVLDTQCLLRLLLQLANIRLFELTMTNFALFPVNI